MVEERAAPYAFVSYASAERARALAVADALEGAGLAVWLDRRSIAGGTSWSAEIVQGIRGCAALLLLWSPAAMASPNVAQEVQLAWESRRPILPLLLALAEPPPALAYALAGRQWVEVLDRAEVDWRPDLLRALAGLGLSPAASAPPALARPPDVPAAPAAPRHNLPAQLTSFVGREREVAEVAHLLAAHRLVTLTGVGGTGKTRLALAVAERALEDYPEGVWLVELAPLADPGLVPQAIATAVGIREQPGEALPATLARLLAPRRLLLALDNCEHLIDACARLADDLLRHCPTVRILATSREQLGVPGEASYRVPSLALPASGAAPSAATLAGAEAVRLFVARAQAAQPRFALTDANAALVAQLCARLDGIPLALELAAARLRALPLEQLAARLDDRFRLLTGGSRTALPRQQTLQATLDWSHRLLDEDERALLRRLSVFAGGWTLEAAEGVCADEHIEGWRVLDLLTGLVDKSLAVLDESGAEPRYRLLETVRQYARERLAETEEGAAVRDRHRDWCLALAEAAAPLLTTGAQTATLARLNAEADNLRAALAWCLTGDVQRGLRLAASLRYFWFYQTRFTEGSEWLAALLAEAPAPTLARAWATCALGHLLTFAGSDLARAEAVLRESVELSRALGAPELLVVALRNLSFILRARYGQGARVAVLEEALALSQTLGDRWSEGVIHYLQGFDARMGGDLARSRALLATSRALLRATGDRVQEAGSLIQASLTACASGDYEGALALAGEIEQLHRLAHLPYLDAALSIVPSEVAWARGATAEAVAWGERLLALAREQQSGIWLALASFVLARALLASGEVPRARALLAPNLAGLGDDFGPGVAHHWLGRAAWQAGERAAALGHLRAALRRFRDFGEWFHAPDSLEALATVLADGDAATAVRLLAAAEATRAAWGMPRPPIEQPGMDATLAAARTALGEATFADAWAAGAALSLAGAVEEALALLDGLVGEGEAAL